MIKKYNDFNNINEANIGSTPARSCIVLRGYIKRIERLNKNEYTNPRFRTGDINKLPWELLNFDKTCENALKNKNFEEAKQLVDKAKSVKYIPLDSDKKAFDISYENVKRTLDRREKKKDLNEGLRDQMTPKSEKEIKDKVGEEKYKIYSKLSDLKKNIPEPFRTSELFLKDNGNDYNGIEVNYHFITFYIELGNDGEWIIEYEDESDDSNGNDIQCKSWEEIYSIIKELTKQSLNNSIEKESKNIKRSEDYISNYNQKIKAIS